MAQRKVAVNYDKRALKVAAHAKFKSASELASLIGKSRSWVSNVLNPLSNVAVSEQELRLICTLCDVDYDSIMCETEEEVKLVTNQATAPLSQPSVVINQNIMLTDDQFQWATDAYM